MDVVVIGAGPAGLMAAAKAAEAGLEVALLEKNKEYGKKLRITGKGRCNVTTAKDKESWLSQVAPNGRFLYSALALFDEKSTFAFFENEGVPLKVERGDRVFPQSDQAEDVRDALVRYAKRKGVRFYPNTTVKNVISTQEGYEIYCGDSFFKTRAVIVATGGASYPGTGSTGDGYRWAKAFDIQVRTPYPSLVPLVMQDQAEAKALMGLSLRNVAVLLETKTGKVLYKGFGELLFTHFGLSGPLILQGSRVASTYWQSHNEPLYLSLDLKPALDAEKLHARFLREYQAHPNAHMQRVMQSFLPKRLVAPVLEKSRVSPQTPFNQLDGESRERLVETLKNFTLMVTHTRPLAEGIVTAGGVDTKALSPKTMMSKKHEGLFFAGEVLDLDAPTGGYSLQIAFTTGYAAGQGAALYIKEKFHDLR